MRRNFVLKEVSSPDCRKNPKVLFLDLVVEVVVVEMFESPTDLLFDLFVLGINVTLWTIR